MTGVDGGRIRLPILLAVLVMALVGCASSASSRVSGAEPRLYVFAWPFASDDAMTPRGGTTEGPPVTLVQEPTAAFERIRAPGLSARERDRRAILAQAGGYRVSFDFVEVMGYAPDHEPAQPYQSWATEYVYVITDEPGQIELQHLLVMRIIGEDGELRGPFVQKHWRQEWRYEAGEAHVYRGRRTWARETRSPAERDGTWLQTVWQVDDAPRYAAWGRWRHDAERSVWTSETTWRPLPRREYTVRDDYDALIGTNRVNVLPTGWVHEQRNHKAVLASPGEIERRVATEYGIARYERIRDYDFAAGDEYLAATADFWRAVRDYWDTLLARHERLHLRRTVDGARLFEPLFRRARSIAEGADHGAEANERFVREAIDTWLVDAPIR